MGMFAKMPPDEVQAIIKANIARYHRIEGFDELGFRRSIEESTKKGYGIYDNILLDRTTSGLGAAILDNSGYPIASIGTTYITNWLSEEQKESCSAKLISASAAISSALFRAIESK
jgi:DNA-binding IclR family transcriptional regulator